MNKTLKLLLVFIIAIITFAIAPGQTKAEDTVPYGNNPHSGRYYDIRGFRMYVEEYGKGKPLLLIHGNGGSIEAFKKNILYFSKDYRVIAADSRAQGKSIDKEDSLSFEMMADDEAALLDKMHIDSAYVLGWSDGGIITLELAIRHPHKVIRMAATGADICPDSTARGVVSSFWEGEKKYYDENKNKTFTKPEEKNDWKIRMLDWRQPNIPLTYLQSISCPALIICGDHDLIRIEHTVQIFQNIPHAYLWVLPNSGHGTLQEHTDDFNRQVDDFFKAPSR